MKEVLKETASKYVFFFLAESCLCFVFVFVFFLQKVRDFECKESVIFTIDLPNCGVLSLSSD